MLFFHALDWIESRMDGTSVAHLLFSCASSTFVFVILYHFLHNFHNSTSLNYSCTPPSYPTLLFIIIHTYASLFSFLCRLATWMLYRPLCIASAVFPVSFCCCYVRDLMGYIFYWMTGCSPHLNVRNFLPWSSPYSVMIDDQFHAYLECFSECTCHH